MRLPHLLPLLLFLTACSSAPFLSTATPTPTATPSPAATISPSATLTATPSPSPTVTLTPTPAPPASFSPDNAYQVVVREGVDLAAKSADELLSLAPAFPADFDYGLLDFKPEHGVEALTPVETVTRAREDIIGGQPVLTEINYVLYADQEGRARLLWNVNEGVLEHAEESSYTDPATGFIARALLVTDGTEDGSMLANWNLWWGLEELAKTPEEMEKSGKITLAQALFDYVLPLDNMWESHYKEFAEIIRPGFFYSERMQPWAYLNNRSAAEIRGLVNKARQLWRGDLQKLGEGEAIEMQFGRQGRIKVAKEGGLFIFRLRYSSRYASRSYHGADGTPAAAFGDMGYFDVRPDEQGRGAVEVEIRTDRQHEEKIGGLGGGILADVLKSLTAGGLTISGIGTDDVYYVYRGSADEMVVDLCGENVAEAWWDKLPPEFGERRVLPRMDIKHRYPVCVIESNKVR